MALSFVVLAVVTALAQSQASPAAAARDELNLGVQAYKNVRYDEAIQHFRAAVNFDPDLINARLYLATAYAQLYIPGADTPENVKNGELAVESFKQAAEMPNASAEGKLHSFKGIASIMFNMKRLDEAADWFQRVADADPTDPEAFYSIGVIRWTQAYQFRMEKQAKAGFEPSQPLPPGPECTEIRARNESGVEDGIRHFKQALELRPDYDDAMAYLNLMYRERADYECDDPQARDADLKLADRWVDRTMAVKKAKAEHEVQQEQRSKPSRSGGGEGRRDRPPHLK